MNALIILNDAPYGTEKTFNGLRTAMALQGAGASVSVYMLADAVTSAVAGQKTPDGYYNVERMLKGVLAKGGKVKL